MAKKLTKKEKGFVKDYAKTENGTAAALKHYDVANKHVATVIASENLTKPYIVAAIEETKRTLAERIPDELLEKVHLEGLAATSVRFTPEGEIIRVEDYATRHKYLDSGIKLKGAYAPEKHLNVSVTLEPSESVKQIADGLLKNQQRTDS